MRDTLDELLAGRDGELRMSAYYYGFVPTGVKAVDRILSAVACAGKGFHHTEDWNDELDYYGGKSYVDLIQQAADEAAAEWAVSREE